MNIKKQIMDWIEDGYIYQVKEMRTNPFVMDLIYSFYEDFYEGDYFTADFMRRFIDTFFEYVQENNFAWSSDYMIFIDYDNSLKMALCNNKCSCQAWCGEITFLKKKNERK